MAKSKSKSNNLIIDFSPYFVGMIFFIISLFLTGLLHGNVKPISNSINTPWGVITSNFIFDGFNNIFAYSFFLILLWLTSLSYKFEVRKERYKATIYGMFIGGFLASGLWLYQMFISNNPVTIGGNSGVVYAFWGACFFLFIVDTLVILSGVIWHKVGKETFYLERLKATKKKWWGGGFVSILVSLIILADLYDGQKSFFSELPHYNTMVHIAGFIIGFLSSLVIYMFGMSKIYKKSKKGNAVQPQKITV